MLLVREGLLLLWWNHGDWLEGLLFIGVIDSLGEVEWVIECLVNVRVCRKGFKGIDREAYFRVINENNFSLNEGLERVFV